MLAKARVPLLRTVFSVVIAALAVEMIVNGIQGELLTLSATNTAAAYRTMTSALTKSSAFCCAPELFSPPPCFYRRGRFPGALRLLPRTLPSLSGRAQRSSPRLSAIFRYAIALDPRGIIQLGLLLLIATPVARVVFTVFAFAYERDWTYVVITLIVLTLLLYSLGALHL